MVTAGKVTFDLHILKESFLVCEREVQQSSSPCCLLGCFCLEVVMNALQELLGLLVLCCVGPPADIRVAEVYREDQGLQIQGYFWLSVGGLLFFLVWWPTADTHYSVTHTGLLLVLTCKLPAGLSSVPRQSSMHFSCSHTWRATLSSHLPHFSFLNSLYHSIAALQTCQLSYLVSVIPTRSQPCISQNHRITEW